MGAGADPGTPGPDDERGGPSTGLDAIEQYGRGERDPETGVYDWYELPEDHEAHGEASGGFTLLDLIDHWSLIVADFQSEYGIELESWHGTGSMFRDRLEGLMFQGTRLFWRATREQPAAEDEDDD